MLILELEKRSRLVEYLQEDSQQLPQDVLAIILVKQVIGISACTVDLAAAGRICHHLEVLVFRRQALSFAYYVACFCSRVKNLDRAPRYKRTEVNKGTEARTGAEDNRESHANKPCSNYHPVCRYIRNRSVV